jgi:ADP-ribosylglycohydrolase
MNVKTIAELELSGNELIGYCLKAFGSAVWALRYCQTFEEGMEAIVREAGDADTNGAVVGALLGAKFGFAGIRRDFLEKMFVGHWMWRELKMFMNTMGMEPPPSIWLP